MTRTVIRRAYVIAMPTERPSREPMDLLIEGDRIAAIGPNLAASEAEEVDGEGRIVIPGLVNAHMHAWQTALRGAAYDWNLLEYIMRMHGAAAAQYTPSDIHLGTLAGALNQINCGTTTLGDFSHNTPTPEHSDAAIEALADAGIRAVFFHGTPRPAGVHGPTPHPREEMERLLKSGRFEKGGLLTLGIAAQGPAHAPADIAEADLRLARDLGVIISMHHSGGPPVAAEVWTRLLDEGLLGPNTNFVHGNHIEDDLLKRLVQAGVTFTITPEVELNDGHGSPITGRLRALGAAPSLGVDIEASISGELLIAARVALAHQRGRDFDALRATPGAPAAAPRLMAAEALAWATLEGARALGLQHRVGTLEPGKQADLVMIDARALNLWPNNDLVTTALHASLANIEAVMIGGAWRKREGRLLYSGLDSLCRDLAVSSARIAGAANLPL